MIPTLRLFSRTTYRGASGSGPGRSGKTSFQTSRDSRKSPNDANWFKRSQRGLYDGARVQSGNNIPDSFQKTKRKFKPNVQRKVVESEILDQAIRVRLTTRVLRTIRKKGGLDYYIATASDWKLGTLGRNLRTLMAEKVKEIRRQEAVTIATPTGATPPPLPSATSSDASARRTSTGTLTQASVAKMTRALKGMKTGSTRVAEAQVL